jgi:hypothetical protein
MNKFPKVQPKIIGDHWVIIEENGVKVLVMYQILYLPLHH